MSPLAERQLRKKHTFDDPVTVLSMLAIRPISRQLTTQSRTFTAMSSAAATHRMSSVGSWLRPDAVKEARAQFAEKKISAEELRKVEDANIAGEGSSKDCCLRVPSTASVFRAS